MRYYFRDLLTLLISLFILSSCENPSNVGLEVKPGDQLMGTLVDTVTVFSKTIQADSAATTGSTQFPLGYLKDPVFGESGAHLAFAVAPHEGDSRIPAGAVIDSAVLIVNYGSEFTGDSLNSTSQIEVFQLADAYTLGKTYYSNEHIDHNADVLGSVTIHRFAFRDSVSIHTIQDDKDTIIRVVPQLRIPIDGDKLSMIFSSTYDSTSFNNSTTFQEKVKGFKIKVNEASQTGIGGIVNLTMASGNGLYVYYKNDAEDTVRRAKYYAIDKSQAMASIDHTYAADINAQLNSQDATFETVYVQGALGLETKIGFPHLAELRGSGWIINKAELVVESDPDGLEHDFPTPAPRLTLYREDIAGQRQPIPDGDTRQNPDPRSFGVGFGGQYEKTNKRYTFILTSFIQDYILNKINDPSVYLAPASIHDLNMVPYLPVINTSTRAILAGGDIGVPKIKLNIYYTKKQ